MRRSVAELAPLGEHERFATKYSQPQYKPKAAVLPYGRSKPYAGKFRCASRTSGLRCKNRSRHGFFLSRQRQSIF